MTESKQALPERWKAKGWKESRGYWSPRPLKVAKVCLSSAMGRCGCLERLQRLRVRASGRQGAKKEGVC